jgi:cell division protein ZapE
VQEIYQKIIQEKNYQPDEQQLALLDILSHFNDTLVNKPLKSRITSFFTNQKNNAGVYVHGSVGRGKTFIVDLFYEALPCKEKKKEHFHAFMLSCHQKIKATNISDNDAITKIVHEFQKQYKVLFLDEFFIANIADAMLLSRILTLLVKAGVKIFLTSNSAPENLYPQGLKREYILPFIDFLQNNLVVFNLDGDTDYRLNKLGKELYISPCNKKQNFLENIIKNITNNNIGLEKFTSKAIHSSENRIFTLKKFYKHIAYLDFSEVCDNFVGTIDYTAIAKEIEILIINNIPQLNHDSEEQALRMINMVDCLYNEKIVVYFFSAVGLDELYIGSKFTHEFLRTTSRIFEMQSEEYLQNSKLMTKNYGNNKDQQKT